MGKQRNDTQWLDITRLTLQLPRLDAAFDGYRLVQISDIHFGTWIDRPRLEAAVERVNGEQPDAVAITGDFVSDDPRGHAPQLVSALGGLQARDGVLAVLGNHDHWTDPLAVAEIIARSGIVNLSNAALTFRRNGSVLHFAGVDCTYEGKDRLDLVLEQLPAEGAAVLLAHEPDFADVSVRSGRFDLQISGHSHGGQMILPWIGPPIRPPHARKYPLGRYQINGMVQYTNRGLGTGRIAVRINCRPEITVFTLRTAG